MTHNEGRTIELVGNGRDVSERNRQERQLKRQIKHFESFGSVLSHDLWTPLDTLGRRLELARETHDGEHFERVEQALERLNTLVKDLSNAVREIQLSDELTEVDLESTCRSSWDLLETESASQVIEETHPIQADKNALTRLPEDLVRNVPNMVGMM